MIVFSEDEIKSIHIEITIFIAKRIKEIRISRGLTQVQLANKIQSDRQYLYKIENTKVGVSATKLAVIAKALEISLTDFFNRQINI